jgi:hypothetical protein
MAYFLLGIFMIALQFLGAVSIFLAIVFRVLFSGALDLMRYDIPGFDETCIMLPLAFPLTLIILGVYPKLKTKNEFTAGLLLISMLILSVVIAIQAFRVLYELVSWFV